MSTYLKFFIKMYFRINIETTNVHSIRKCAQLKKNPLMHIHIFFSVLL